MSQPTSLGDSKGPVPEEGEETAPGSHAAAEQHSASPDQQRQNKTTASRAEVEELKLQLKLLYSEMDDIAQHLAGR